LVEHAARSVMVFRPGIRSARVEVVEELAEGHTLPALRAACVQQGPAVLAVGNRGLGGVKGLLLGSASRWVLNQALPGPCPRRRPVS
jgi:nucleotide-binding universal stress UspA family protein